MSVDLFKELDNLPCGHLQTREDGTILHVNLRFAEWVGKSKDELVGHRFQDLLTMGGKIFHHTHWSPLIRMQGSVSEVKLELLTPTGSVPMVLNAIRRDDGTGEFLHDIAAYVARDRDRYEQELIRSRKKLEDLVAELNILHSAARDRATFAEQMMGIVSHDLRNPLGAIHVGAELLGSYTQSEAQQRVVSRILSSTKRASHLIDDLLDFTSARVGNGIQVNVTPIMLHDVIDEGLDELRLAYASRAIVHQREGGQACMGDSRRLVQLVGNLVSNAIVYGAQNSPITVTTSVGTSASITVQNLGPTIPADVQAKMFEPMTRGEDRGAARSVGLGLFIVREIARAHGGTASVASADQQTTIRIEWPAQRPTPPR
ncbi:MAG TPA: PAS domain-containing sensor histidine kinase [Kofleriaceae bacterium]